MGSIIVSNLGKAYKQYPNRWGRLAEWVGLSRTPQHSLKWVMQEVNFAISPGESVGIVGVNGAGKSTLLKIITGTTQPTTGSVHTEGRVAALLELGMGFHPDFTGRQNASMAGQLMGYGRDQIERLMPDIEAFAEIGDYIDLPNRVYSSGMQMRLAFAVATAWRPDILIVDEALSVGDARFQAKCYQRIANFKKLGTTLLLVSHSAGDIVKHCDRAIMLKDGHVEMDSSSRAVTNRYLDELFGKKRPQYGKAPEADVPADEDTLLLAEDIDQFHTRPGYRKEEHRWGHGGAVILDYIVRSGGQTYPSRIEGNAMTEFIFKIRFEKDFDGIVPGFLIKTLEGIFLYGTNSFLASEGRKAIVVQAGDVKVFKFSLPMRLNEGHYLASFGVSSGSPLTELIPLDRRYDSVLFHVGRSMQFWGIVDFQSEFDIVTHVVHQVSI